MLVKWFCLCKKNEEIVNQLLIHCEYISYLWHLVLNLFRVLWAMLSNIIELLHCWKTQVWGHPRGYSLCGAFGEKGIGISLRIASPACFV